MKTTTTTLSTTTLGTINLTPMQLMAFRVSEDARTLRNRADIYIEDVDSEYDRARAAGVIVSILEDVADLRALGGLIRSIQNPLKRARLDASLRTR